MPADVAKAITNDPREGGVAHYAIFHILSCLFNDIKPTYFMALENTKHTDNTITFKQIVDMHYIRKGDYFGDKKFNYSGDWTMTQTTVPPLIMMIFEKHTPTAQLPRTQTLATYTYNLESFVYNVEILQANHTPTGAVNHAIAVFRCGDQYVDFDSNNKITSIESLETYKFNQLGSVDYALYLRG